MTTLAIDTSNQEMALSLSDEGNVIGEFFTASQKNHSVTLMPAIDFLLKTNHKKPADITKIIVAKGPGSYTGLRIGVTTAKTLAWTLQADLHAVSSLAVIAASKKENIGLIVPIINARRNNVYTGIYKWEDGQLVNDVADRHIEFGTWLEELKKINRPVFFVGSDLSLFKDQIMEVFGESSFDDHQSNNVIRPMSMVALANETNIVGNIEEFIPTYLKRVEAEEKWLETHSVEDTNYVERV